MSRVLGRSFKKITYFYPLQHFFDVLTDLGGGVVWTIKEVEVQLPLQDWQFGMEQSAKVLQLGKNKKYALVFT